MARLWKEASSLMILTRSNLKNITEIPLQKPMQLRITGQHSEHQNYNLLMLKRNKKMKFLANSYVFPGGLVDKADFSDSWWEVFRKRSSTDDLSTCSYLVTPTPGVFQPSHYKWIDPDIENGIINGKYLPPDLALRLTAIRETFEESGVFIARSNDAPLGNPVQVQIVENTSVWQDRIQKDASEMIKLCLELNCSPDVWSLYPWSNWLTPSHFKPRYDSLFYICHLNDIPDVRCSSEVSNYLWCTPLQYLSMIGKQEIFVPPPQVYELGGLLHFEDLSTFKEYFKERINKPMQLMFPVQAKVKNGFLLIFPGDELYPEEPDILGQKPIANYDATIEELSSSATLVNRVSFCNNDVWQLNCNIELDDERKISICMSGSGILPLS